MPEQFVVAVMRIDVVGDGSGTINASSLAQHTHRLRSQLCLAPLAPALGPVPMAPWLCVAPGLIRLLAAHLAPASSDHRMRLYPLLALLCRTMQSRRGLPMRQLSAIGCTLRRCPWNPACPTCSIRT